LVLFSPVAIGGVRGPQAVVANARVATTSQIRFRSMPHRSARLRPSDEESVAMNLLWISGRFGGAAAALVVDHAMSWPIT